MRGRRCAELVTGDLIEFAAQLFDVQTAEILMELPAALSSSERITILQDFELARSHVVTTLTIKLGHWKVPPFVVFGMGHCNAAKAFDLYLKAVASSHAHLLLERLRSSQLAADRAYYEDLKACLPVTDNPDDAPHIRALIGELRLAPSAERPEEGVHAVVHKAVRRAPHHTCSYVSLSVRFPQFMKESMSTPERFQGFALRFAMIPDSRRAAEALGLGSHPTSAAHARGRDRRSRVHFDVIYRNDPWTRYKLRLPEIQRETRSERVVPGATLNCICFMSVRASCQKVCCVGVAAVLRYKYVCACMAVL